MTRLWQVDCPGHASLIRTIIGGAQIMDMMLLVIDATKGMQAQTVECVVIGQAVMARGGDVIVVLNKVFYTIVARPSCKYISPLTFDG